MQEGRIAKLKELNPVSWDLTLGYPTWLSLSSWPVKTIIPFPRGN